jgi:hypothetical protein
VGGAPIIPVSLGLVFAAALSSISRLHLLARHSVTQTARPRHVCSFYEGLE